MPRSGPPSTIRSPRVPTPTSTSSCALRSRKRRCCRPWLVRSMKSIPGIGTMNEMTMASKPNQSPSAYIHLSSAWLVGGFAFVALLLGVVGLYGVIAYSVGRRTREIGVRMALGAQRKSVYQLILMEAAWLTGIGIVAGLFCAVGAATLIRGLLFGVRSWDAATLAAVACVLQSLPCWPATSPRAEQHRSIRWKRCGTSKGHDAMHGLVQDVRYAGRQLLKSPGFAGLTIVIVAVGIGAATAMFSLVDRILFRSLPYPDDEQLVSVGVVAPIIDGEFLFASNYLDWRERQTAFTNLTSAAGVNDCDLTDGQPVRVACAAVASTFLPTFSIQPLLGRNFTREEDQPKSPRVALLTYNFVAGPVRRRPKCGWQGDVRRWPSRRRSLECFRMISNIPRSPTPIWLSRKRSMNRLCNGT